MDTNIITYLACICFLFIFGRIFIVPIKKILKLVINSILGGVTIFLINLVGGMWGFHIGLNIFTSILVGLLGLPGAVCLVIIKLLIWKRDWGRILNLEKNQERRLWVLNPDFFYSTVTDFAKFLGLSTSNPFSLEIW